MLTWAICSDEAITGEALISLQHADLKEMDMHSMGNRLTLLKTVYEVKVKQNIPIDESHFVPLCKSLLPPEWFYIHRSLFEAAAYGDEDQFANQDDIARIVESIRLRDERIVAAEQELRFIKEDLVRVQEENRKLREDFLPLVRMAKDRLQPLPTPETGEHPQPQQAQLQPEKEKLSGGLARKWSARKLFNPHSPKNPSPTIHEGRSIVETNTLDPSAAAVAAASHLASSITAHSQTVISPHMASQPSPTSPPYATSAGGPHTFPRNEGPTSRHQNPYAELETSTTPQPGSNWSAPMGSDRGVAPQTASAPRDRDRDRERERERDRDRDRDPAKDRSQRGHRGEDTKDYPNIFKSFRVGLEDPCYKVLPVALQKYHINADWRDFSLYIVHGDQERCLGLDEKPLLLFKDLDKLGRNPMFMLRKHAAPEFGHQSTIAPAPAPTLTGGAGVGERLIGGAGVRKDGGGGGVATTAAAAAAAAAGGAMMTTRTTTTTTTNLPGGVL